MEGERDRDNGVGNLMRRGGGELVGYGMPW